MAFQTYINNVDNSKLAGLKTPITYLNADQFFGAWHRPTADFKAYIGTNSQIVRDAVIDLLKASLVPIPNDWYTGINNNVTFRHELPNGLWLVAHIKKVGDDYQHIYGVTSYNDTTHDYSSQNSYYNQDANYFVNTYMNQSNFPTHAGWLHIHDVVTNHDYIGFCALWDNWNTISSMFLLDMDRVHFEPYIVDPDLPEPSKPAGYDGGGGRGHGSDSIPIPAKPTLNISQLGYLNVYKVTTSGLSGMINELFPNLDNPIFPVPTGDGTLSDIAQSVNSMGSALINFCVNFANSNIMNYVIDTHLIPVTPTVGSSEHIKTGFRTLEVTAPKVSEDYVDFDCGTVEIGELYYNFVDYMTQCQLFLPYVGYVPLQPEYFLNGKLQVVYRFNIIDGSFTAFVLSSSSKSELKNSVVGSYSGNCCVHIPIRSTDYASIVSGLVGAISAQQTSVIGTASAGVETLGLMPEKPFFNMSNGFNATSSYVGIRKPYLIIKTRVPAFPAGYGSAEGFPLHVTGRIGDYSGFTICSGVHVENFNATDEEKAEIERILTTGVIL